MIRNENLPHADAGQTPLTIDDLQGLRLSSITRRSELNEAEARNIDQAVKKFLSGRRNRIDLTRVDGIQKLHREMFAETWEWAGKWRTRDTSPGVDYRQIAVQVRLAGENFRHWNDHSVFPAQEAAARFHHELIRIHPFLNGNGRHGRLVADVVLHQRGLQPFAWGSVQAPGPRRDAYLSAMRTADGGDFGPLLEFLSVA